MNEIEVVVDVRQSPDSPELIVLKQKLVTTGDLHPSGPPVETRLGLTNRKAELSVFEFADQRGGYVLAAHVKNVGTTPFNIDKVVFECQFEEPPDVRTASGVQAKEIGRGFELVPRDRALEGAQLPGDSRDYFLPQEVYDGVALLGTSLPPGQYWIAAYSGREELGRVSGEYIRPFFQRSTGIVLHRRAQPVFDTLPERDRLAVVRAVVRLRGVDQEYWPSDTVHEFKDVPHVYVVRVTPELHVLVTQTEHKGVEISDIVRRATLDQFDKAEVGEGEKA
jgi:hypothetical protein